MKIRNTTRDRNGLPQPVKSLHLKDVPAGKGSRPRPTSPAYRDNFTSINWSR